MVTAETNFPDSVAFTVPNAVSDKPSVSGNGGKLQLPSVTIICADCHKYGAAVASIQRCLQVVIPAKAVFLTDIPITVEGIEVVQIPTIKSKEQYSEFIIRHLHEYFESDYCLIVQHDSGICYPEAWEDSFLDYDVLGAAWLYTDGRNVSNGGFSLRSKKLQTILGTDPHIEITSPEDEIIGRLYRGYLEEKHGIKFPTDEVADRFSFELREPRCKTFGKHGDFHQQYRPTVIIKRTAAAGDCLLLEPVARYYAAKGWNVVLDIPIEFFALFSNHYFPIKHIGNFDRGRITPEKEINLDLSYESKPRQNYLKSYFEFCGITDYKLTKPQLYPLVGKETRLFEKYFVLHLDRRLTEERNPIDINWKQVKRHIENLGFTVIQVGSNDSEEVGLRVNTKNNIGLLKFIVGGASAFIGVDSLPSHIAVAYNIPSVLLFGSTNPHYIHSDLDNVEVIQGKCSTPNCWHKEGGTAGQICAFKDTPNYLQCCKHSADDIIDAINKFVKQ